MIVATLLVRDEEEIVEQNVRFHLENGVDAFIVTDNGSMDGTRSIISKFPEVREIIDEPRHDFQQSAWVRRMIEIASRLNPEWIVNIDADEFWHGLKSLQDVPKPIQVVAARVWHHRPERGLRYGGFDREHMPRKVLDTRMPKVAHRAFSGVQIEMGNHRVVNCPAHMWKPLDVHHYGIRSYEQFESKVLNGGSACAASKLPPECCSHWREWYQAWLRGELRDVYEAFFDDYYWLSLQIAGRMSWLDANNGQPLPDKRQVRAMLRRHLDCPPARSRLDGPQLVGRATSEPWTLELLIRVVRNRAGTMHFDELAFDGRLRPEWLPYLGFLIEVTQCVSFKSLRSMTEGDFGEWIRDAQDGPAPDELPTLIRIYRLALQDVLGQL